MTIIHTHSALLIVLGFYFVSSFSINILAKQAAPLSAVEQKEYELIAERFQTYENMLNAVGWTLCHCADEKEKKAAEKTLALFPAFVDTNKMSRLVEAGGIKGFKNEVSTLLTNKDSVIRGFSAILLAIVGDPSYKSSIAALLSDKNGLTEKEAGNFFINFDRSRAAMALGLMGATEYAPRLAELLRSSDCNDRTGAALGLGYMGAKEHAPAIAELLTNDTEDDRAHAISALAELHATAYTKEIVKLLDTFGNSSISEIACYALVRLDAKDEVDSISVLLHKKFIQGIAAKAIALLGSKKYTQKIAELLQNTNAIIRCDALTALGILQAKEYTDNIAVHLHDEVTFVRPYAAVALLLMGDDKYSDEIIETIQFNNTIESAKTTAYFAQYIRLYPLVAERQRQLSIRAKEEWTRVFHATKQHRTKTRAKGN